MMSVPNGDSPAVWFHVASPLFTGQMPDEREMLERKAAWYDFTYSGALEELRRFCGMGSGKGGMADIACYSPGDVVRIWHPRNQDPVRVIFPSDRKSTRLN